MLLHPFLPFSSEEIWRQLALAQPLATIPGNRRRGLLLDPGHKIEEAQPPVPEGRGPDLDALRKFLENRSSSK